MPSRDVEINLIGNDRTGAATRSAANNLDQLARKIDKFNGKTIGDKRATVKTKVDNSAAAASANKLKQTFAKAGDEAGQSFTSRLRNQIRRFNPDFGSVIDSNRKTFGTAGDRAGAAFASRFRSKIASMHETVRLKVRVHTDDTVMEGVAKRLTGALGRAMASVVNDGSRAIGSAIRLMALRAPQIAGPAIVIVAARLAGLLGQAITAAFGLALGPGLLAAPIAFMLVQQAKASKETVKQEKAVAALRKRLNNATNKDTKERLQKQLAAEERVLEELRKQSQQWDTIKSKAKAFMQFISAPLKLPLQDSINVIFQGLERLKGPVRGIMAALGTALPGFTQGVMDTFLNFINALKPALPGIVAGMQAWAVELPKIGTAFGNMIAKIMANPEAVTTAIQNISQVMQSLISGTGTIVSGLTRLGNAFFAFETNIDALENKNLGGLTGAFGGAFRQITTTIYEEVIQWLTLLSRFTTAWAKINPLMKGPAEAIANTLAGVKADFEGLKNSWAQTDAEISRRQIKAKITANIADLKNKLAVAKQQLKDPNLTKAKKIEIKANIADLRLKIATAKAQKASLAKKPSISKLQGNLKDLQAKIAAGKRALDTVKNKKTEAKIRADIRQAQAQVARIKAQIASIKGKTVTVRINQNTYLTRTVKTNRIVRVKDPGASAGSSWQAALSGGAMSRTEPPSVNVAAPEVSTRVFLDSREIQVVARSTVREANNRDTWRARVGRR